MFWTGVFTGLAVGVLVGVPLTLAELKRQTARARRAEGRERDARRLAEIGAMTGGLAHEIKNPLSTIGLNAQLLAEGIADLPVDDLDKGRLVRRIDSLRREVDRLRETLADFLRFAGQVKFEPRQTDLNQIVEELADFYMPQARHKGISLRTDLAPGPLVAMIDPSHFKQALLNLMLNATQAMEGQQPGEGSGQHAHAEAPRARELILRTAATRKRAGEPPAWELHVIDTGPGIPPETLARLFTPYFTTKGGGTGLGLPTTRRLIEEQGGSIEVVTEVGKGSDFVIRVPKASTAPEPAGRI